jgi:hypothetical protein
VDIDSYFLKTRRRRLSTSRTGKEKGSRKQAWRGNLSISSESRRSGSTEEEEEEEEEEARKETKA